MSRGFGRWQRLLLHELYHNPRPQSLLTSRPWIDTRRLTASSSEYSAIRRAAHKLVAAGLAECACGGYAHTLMQPKQVPAMALKCCKQGQVVEFATLKAATS